MRASFRALPKAARVTLWTILGLFVAFVFIGAIAPANKTATPKPAAVTTPTPPVVHHHRKRHHRPAPAPVATTPAPAPAQTATQAPAPSTTTQAQPPRARPKTSAPQAMLATPNSARPTNASVTSPGRAAPSCAAPTTPTVTRAGSAAPAPTTAVKDEARGAGGWRSSWPRGHRGRARRAGRRRPTRWPEPVHRVHVSRPPWSFTQLRAVGSTDGGARRTLLGSMSASIRACGSRSIA